MRAGRALAWQHDRRVARAPAGAAASQRPAAMRGVYCEPWNVVGKMRRHYRPGRGRALAPGPALIPSGRRVWHRHVHHPGHAEAVAQHAVQRRPRAGAKLLQDDAAVLQPVPQPANRVGIVAAQRDEEGIAARVPVQARLDVVSHYGETVLACDLAPDNVVGVDGIVCPAGLGIGHQGLLAFEYVVIKRQRGAGIAAEVEMGDGTNRHGALLEWFEWWLATRLL